MISAYSIILAAAAYMAGWLFAGHGEMSFGAVWAMVAVLAVAGFVGAAVAEGRRE